MRPGRRRLTIVAAVCSLALLLALALVLSKSGHHRTGTNAAARSAFMPVWSGYKICQAGEYIQRGTGRIRFFPVPTPFPAGPFVVTLLRKGHAPLSARVPAHRYVKSEAAAANLPAIARTNSVNATVCIRNVGAKAAGVIGEVVPNQGGTALLLPGPRVTKPPWVHIHLDYQFRKSQSWWSFAPTVATRYGLVKASFFGAWTFWLTIVLLLALALGTIWYAAREFAR